MQMIAPRDIYELADTVEAELLAQEGADLEQVKELANELDLQCQACLNNFALNQFRNKTYWFCGI